MRSKKKVSRTEIGDELGKTSRSMLLEKKPDNLLFASFLSVLQGDHGGVEYACEAHHQLLATRGLLHPTSRLVSDRPFRGEALLEGLCIDDYFAISIQDKESKEESLSKRRFRVAQEIYQEKKILGSPDKDLIDVDRGKVIGAFINAGEEAADLGLITIYRSTARKEVLFSLDLTSHCPAHPHDGLPSCLPYGRVDIYTPV